MKAKAGLSHSKLAASIPIEEVILAQMVIRVIITFYLQLRS